MHVGGGSAAGFSERNRNQPRGSSWSVPFGRLAWRQTGAVCRRFAAHRQWDQYSRPSAFVQTVEGSGANAQKQEKRPLQALPEERMKGLEPSTFCMVGRCERQSS